ncbi:MAG: hypothetical protein AAGH19_09010 [Pseudomonadota bacterium]
MNKLLPLFAVGALMTFQAEARDNFVTSPTAPYPPGCTSSNNTGVITPTGGRQVYNDSNITLRDAGGGSDANVNLQVFRRGCIDEDRSLMYVRLEPFDFMREVAVPRAFLLRGDTRIPMRLTPEANTFEVDFTGFLLQPGVYEFLVDGAAESRFRPGDPVVTPQEYTGPITLVLQDALDPSNEYTLPLPAWLETIRPPRYPLNGRLSGPWVSAGAERQGFVISFNEFLAEDGVEQQVFFSWYTFDADGEPLWLASSNFYDFNASQVELPLSLLTGGEFLGDQAPTETPVGSALMRTEGCNEITLTYDLEAIGLGSGSLTLERSFALETAGYACRDVQARLDDLGR